ncbi:hypothetical protein K402DRAFT_394833 [Aulographum hederae CBS 113979]|uniref:RRM domain-containing protein n=1 Tax=Aulographum hederae CBS 113979 TaxID=1176131 RepID=A0A6G1GXH7_9PEZI|nr:hypothetical protein K402DRAFT_394833 [Aulographum hederae CBS 113979]
MNSIRQIAKLNAAELKECVSTEGSWHTDYRDTAFVNFGGVPLDLSEGDVITIFSQYGEPVWIKLARDKETGKSRGFGWLKYEDQRSCDLAVDNLGGAKIMDRLLRVDHARYKPMKDENMEDGSIGIDGDMGAQASMDVEESEEESRPLLPEERELMKMIAEQDPDDPMGDFMVNQKRKEVETALRKLELPSKTHKDRHRHKSTRRHRERSRDRKPRRNEGDDSEEGERRPRKDRQLKGSRDGKFRQSKYQDSEEEEQQRRKRRHSELSHDSPKRYAQGEDSGKVDRTRTKHCKHRHRSRSGERRGKSDSGEEVTGQKHRQRSPDRRRRSKP